MSGADSPLGSGTIWSPRQGRMNGRAGGVGLGGGGGRMVRGGAGGRGRGMNLAQREAMQKRMAAARAQNMTPEERLRMAQMQQARGRGRAFRGGRGGRGRLQQQQQQRRRPTSYLEFFTTNQLTRLKIMSCLTEDERKVLGSVYPMFKPRELTPQQKKMMEERQKKIAMAKKAQEERKAALAAKAAEDIPPSDEEKKKLSDEEKKVAEEEKRISEEEKMLAKEDEEAGGVILLQEIANFKDGTEESVDDAKETETIKEVIEDGDKAEEASSGGMKDEESAGEAVAAARAAQILLLQAKRKEQEAAMAANLTDPHTLLARLNTKRLYRRIRYLQKKDKDYDVTKAYPFNKTTEQIAIAEWQDILNEYTERQKQLWKERQEKEAEEKRLTGGAEEAEKNGTEVATATGEHIVFGEIATDKEEEEEIVVGAVGDEPEEGDVLSVEKALEKVDLQSVEKSVEETDSEDVNKEDEDNNAVEDAEDKEVTKELEVTKNGQEANGESKDEIEGNKEPTKPNILTLPSKCELIMFSPCPRAVAVMASYPRSGNSLLRTLYERTTLRVSGSDMRGGLQKHDLVGEAATQTNCVQFVKTHYPERMGAPPLRVDRAVLLVRNPYDAMESYFNLMTTNTHTSSLSEEDRKKHEKIFADMARKEILVWRDFHEYWLSRNIPLLVIRYEDLIRYTDKVVAKVIKFVLEVKSMKFFEERIDRCIREEQLEKLGSYKPRSGGIGRSLTKGVYSPELLSDINCGIMDTMAKFGYTEMLVPNPSEWELEPMDQLGVEIVPTERQPLVINQKGLVRNAQRNTDWRAVKRQMEMKENQ